MIPVGFPSSSPWESTQPRTATKSLTKLGMEHLNMASLPWITVSWKVWESYTWPDTGIKIKYQTWFFLPKPFLNRRVFSWNDADVDYKTWLIYWHEGESFQIRYKIIKWLRCCITLHSAFIVFNRLGLTSYINLVDFIT